MDRLLKSLERIPSLVVLPEESRGLWEMCLSDVWLPGSISEWRETVDAPWEVPINEVLFVNFSETETQELVDTFGFPTVDLPAFPPIEWVNRKLPECFNALCTEQSKLLRQSQLVQTVTERVSHSLPDIVVVLVFDGLSFYDVANWTFQKSWSVVYEPCLVDGLSTTSSGMRRLIGTPPLTHRLFELGYMQRLGFSYWRRSQNELADVLFAEFPTSQMFRVSSFEDVLDRVTQAEFTGHTFIQIVRTGLDGVCHSYRDKPNTDALLDQLKQDVECIVNVVAASSKSMRVFITSDHGILWYKEQKVLPLGIGRGSARYTDTGFTGDVFGVDIAENGASYTSLVGDTTIARDRRVTEWGFHGGISAQESLVPFLDITPRQ